MVYCDVNKRRLHCSLHYPLLHPQTQKTTTELRSNWAPAEAVYADKTKIDAAAGTVNAAMIISEPFALHALT